MDRPIASEKASFLWDPPVSDLVGSDPKHLVELKARYEDLGKARALLKGAEHVATVRQLDTYFSLGERRLKLRSVEGVREGQLVYYERPDAAGVKESRVLLATLPDAPAVREILRQVFPVKAEVRKTREIYRLQGVQIHGHGPGARQVPRVRVDPRGPFRVGGGPETPRVVAGLLPDSRGGPHDVVL